MNIRTIPLGLLLAASVAHAQVTSWTAPALTKVFPDASPGASHAIRLQACRNEVEWGQIVFRSPERVTVRLRVSDLVSASGRVIPAASISLHPAVYVHVTHLSGNGTRERYWPEVLPVGDTVTLEPNRNQPVYVQVRVPEGAAQGLYEGTVAVGERRGLEARTTPVVIPLRLRVWPLTIPSTPTTRTSYYVWWEGIEERFGLADKPELKQRVFDRFFAFMLDHRLCPMSLPVDIKQADRYMRDPRVNGVRLPYCDDDAGLRDTISFVKARGWLSRCYYYLLDEPPRRMWPEVRRAGFQIAGLDPLMARLDTIQPEPELEGAVSIWCPNVESVYLYDVGGVTDPDRSRSVTVPTVTVPTVTVPTVTAPALPLSHSPSPEVWWYTCVFPKYPYPTFLLDDDAIAPRLLFWSQPRHGLTGSLYINTIHWGPEGNDPWAEAAVDPVLLNNNDGLLMYTGRGRTLADAHPVTGVRLEMIRDGLEDVELCNMLGREVARLAGPAVAQQHLAALASQVLPDLRHPDRNPRHLLALRELVADEIMALQANPGALEELLALPVRPSPESASATDAPTRNGPTRVAEDKFAVALRGTPVIDGKLADACWQASLAANALGTRTVITRFRNLTGRIWPSQETVVNCLHDDANLYFAFRCGEPEIAKLTPLSEQPSLAQVDRVAVALSVDGLERWFVVTMEGIQLEGSLRQPVRVRAGRWEAKTHLERSAGFQPAPAMSSAGFQPASAVRNLGLCPPITVSSAGFQPAPVVRNLGRRPPITVSSAGFQPAMRALNPLVSGGLEARTTEGGDAGARGGLEARTTSPVAFNLFRFAAPGQETLYFTGRHSSKRNPFEFGRLELR